MPTKTETFLERIRADHPNGPALRNAVVEMFGASERLAAKRAELVRSGKLTTQGLAQELSDALPAVVTAQTRARAPIEKALAEIKSRRAALQIKPADPNNLAAAIERLGIQGYLSGLEPGARQALALTTKDRRILEAIVSAPPELSGFVGTLAPTFKQVEERYLEDTHRDELRSIDDLESVVEAAVAASQTARNDIQSVVGLNNRDFNAIAGPIEMKANAPWLVKMKGQEDLVLRVRPEKRGTAEFQTNATQEEIRDGVYFEDEAAYQAARASTGAPSYSATNGAG
jgi:hypothetical protein